MTRVIVCRRGGQPPPPCPECGARVTERIEGQLPHVVIVQCCTRCLWGRENERENP